VYFEEGQEFKSINQLRAHLHLEGCKRCDLGFQPNINGCCVSKGPETTTKMIIGEAPGKNEDSTRLPFTGPAGKLLDDIWKAAGMDTKDWYITNVVLCRPVAEKGSGKENYTPRVEQRKQCRPHLDAQISLLKPKIIVTLGKPATEAILGLSGLRMGDVRGQLRGGPSIASFDSAEVVTDAPFIFPMIHPAAILHNTGTKRYDIYRQQTWDDVRKLKSIIDERNI